MVIQDVPDNLSNAECIRHLKTCALELRAGQPGSAEIAGDLR